MSADEQADGSEGGHDVLSMSYVAVICCGLAGAIVLFLVFAAALHSGGGTDQPAAAAVSASPNAPNAGMTIPDLPHTGVQDIVSATLTLDDVKKPTELIVEWDPQPDEPLAVAQTITLDRNKGPTAFCSPVWIEGISSGADMSVSVEYPATNSANQERKISGRMVVAAGGVVADPKQVQFILTPGRRVLVGTIHLRADGPANWFEPSAEATPPTRKKP